VSCLYCDQDQLDRADLQVRSVDPASQDHKAHEDSRVSLEVLVTRVLLVLLDSPASLAPREPLDSQVSAGPRELRDPLDSRELPETSVHRVRWDLLDHRVLLEMLVRRVSLDHRAMLDHSEPLDSQVSSPSSTYLLCFHSRLQYYRRQWIGYLVEMKI